MKMKLKWTPRAYEQLYEIIAYITKDSKKNAGEIFDRIHSTALKLVDFPEMGAHPHDERLLRSGYRMLVVEKFLILYMIDGDAVVIMGVVHGAQQYEHLFK